MERDVLSKELKFYIPESIENLRAQPIAMYGGKVDEISTAGMVSSACMDVVVCMRYM